MRILAVAGTRPEVIKLGPVMEALEERGAEVRLLLTNQSPDLVKDADLDVVGFTMDGRWAGLSDGIQRTMFEAQHEIRMLGPDAILIVGDTASALAGALAGYLAEVPVGHVEAGLRTYRENPRPEEAFRGAIARFARWHFCPDRNSAKNVGWELDYPGDIYITGNPVIDTLPNQNFHVLATLHRRENWGEPIENALAVLHDFAETNEHAQVEVIRHPNWTEHVRCCPDQRSEIGFYLADPVPHAAFREMLSRSDLVVTDSGGLQEEAAYLGVDCIVYREKTERTALSDCGAVRVVGDGGPEKLREMLREAHQKRFCYGSGDAGEQIAEILVEELTHEA